MIGKLQGIVDHIGDGFVIIMAGNVGYKVFCSEYLTAKSTVSLWIETVVREDSIRLFGFTTMAGMELFNKLTSVSGVGPKGAMAILGTLKPDVLMSAIATGDAKTIATAPGVGKKVAEKIIVELKGKTMGAAFAFDMDSGTNNLSDLLSALESLGYKRIDIVEMAQKLVNENPDADVTKLVPLALKVISNK
ncbi:Holliday junction branch migration protein RuvA [Lachnospiraceae bacterium OttesenSCG-928-E19]|nr:Holliday junction branch migration protein RuvA [Lachnospiraceae bacterium OttesenSCG-928-E19]